MKHLYRSLHPEAEVVSFELIDSGLILEFRGSPLRYVYNSSRPGPEHIQRMLELAREGRSLTTYVSWFVHSNYAARLEPGEKWLPQK